MTKTRLLKSMTEAGVRTDEQMEGSALSIVICVCMSIHRYICKYM